MRLTVGVVLAKPALSIVLGLESPDCIPHREGRIGVERDNHVLVHWKPLFLLRVWPLVRDQLVVSSELGCESQLDRPHFHIRQESFFLPVHFQSPAVIFFVGNDFRNDAVICA